MGRLPPYINTKGDYVIVKLSPSREKNVWESEKFWRTNSIHTTRTTRQQEQPDNKKMLRQARLLRPSLKSTSWSYVARRFQSTSVYNDTMSLLKQDLKQAMIKKENLTKNTIRCIMSDIKNSEIDGAQQNEFNLYKVLNKMIKQRHQSSIDYQNQNRQDLADNEIKEIAVIEKFVKSLNIASNDEIIEKLTLFLSDLKAKDHNLHMSKIFPLILDDLAKLWNSSVDLVKPFVPRVYKQVFQK